MSISINQCINRCKQNYGNNQTYNSKCEERIKIYTVDSNITEIDESVCDELIFQIQSEKEQEQLKKEKEIKDSHEKCYNNCMEFINNLDICNNFIEQNKNNIITLEKCNEFIQNNTESLPKQELLDFSQMKSTTDLQREIDHIQTETYIPEPVIKPVMPTVMKLSFNKQKYETQINDLLKVLQQKIINKFNEETLFFTIITIRENLYFEEDYKKYIENLTDINNNFDDYSADKELFTAIINSLVSLFESNKKQLQTLIENEKREAEKREVERREAERREAERRETERREAERRETERREAERRETERREAERREAERRETERREAERRVKEEAERREAERRAKEEAERRTHPPYKPFLQLPIRNFKWRGNLCWMYAYLQYIYRIQCIHDLILNTARPNISYEPSSDDNINIKIDFIDPLFRRYNSTINLKDLFENINKIIKANETTFTSSKRKNIFMAHNTKIADGYKLSTIIDHRDKCKWILQLIYNDIYNNIIKDNINQYIIISLWFIFNFLNSNIGNIVDVYSKVNEKYHWFENEEEKDNIEDFIHIFILIIAYSVNKHIYTDSEPQELNNKFKEIFICLQTENYLDFMKKFKDQTCFILYGSGHYINLIKDIDTVFYILDSQYNNKLYYNRCKDTDEPIEQIISKQTTIDNYIEQFPIMFIDEENISHTYKVIHGGGNILTNSFNKYKLKYN